MDKGRTLLLSEVAESSKRAMIKASKLLLEGAGQLPSAVEAMDYAIHYRRAITDEEYARLSREWCSIPAVHEAGHGLLLEQNT